MSVKIIWSDTTLLKKLVTLRLDRKLDSEELWKAIVDKIQTFVYT